MERKLTELEKSALLRANKAGLIAIPGGTAAETDNFLHTLLRLRAAGLVSRSQGIFYRPFVITKLGRLHLGAQGSGVQRAVLEGRCVFDCNRGRKRRG